MKVVNILFFIILILGVADILIEYRPKIDVIISGNKYVVLLWYYKHYRNGNMKRVYIKLFEI